MIRFEELLLVVNNVKGMIDFIRPSFFLIFPQKVVNWQLKSLGEGEWCFKEH